MSWAEVTPGQWQRPIGEDELFLKRVGDPGHALNREHWAINYIVDFTPVGSFADEDLAALFLKSWKTLRFEQPSIAAYPVDDDVLVYDVPGDESLNKWATETFAVIQDKTADEVILDLRPSPFAVLYYLPKKNELLGHTAHWRSDGIGVLMLLNALLTIAARSSLPEPALLEWGTESARLAPSVEDVAGMPLKPSEADAAIATKTVETFFLIPGSTGIPYLGDSNTVPAGTRSARLQLTEEETGNIIRFCKEHGFSVTAAVHAAVAAANYALADESHKQRHYTSTVRFSIRPYLPDPYSQPEYASGVYTTGWMKALPADSLWIDRARSYQQDYSRGLSPEFLSAHREYAIRLDELVHSAPPEGEPPSDIDISSLGLAEKLISREMGTAARGFYVNGVSVGTEILSRQGVCFVWTFRDRLTLNIVYNESFHEQEQMNNFATLVKGSLLQELRGQ